MTMAHSPRPGSPELSPTLAAARDSAVVSPLDGLAVLAIAGPVAASFLQGQLSCDVAALETGSCRYGSFNSPKGRMLANFVLWRRSPDGFGMLLASDIAEAVAKRLRMYVLRSKVTIADVSANTQRVGIGGPDGANAVRAAFGGAPAPFEVHGHGDAVTLLGLTGNRFIALASGRDDDLVTRLSSHATAADFAVWRWLTIRSGTPVITAATQDAFVAQAANLDVLGGIDFQKGCYTGQEIIARTQHLGRLKERLFAFHVKADEVLAGSRVFGSAFGDQACGVVVNAAPAPGGGSDVLAVVQLAAAADGPLHLGEPAGATLTPLPLPYEIPEPAPRRGRVGTPR